MNPARVLVVGAGEGAARFVEPLAGAGFDVAAVDAAPPQTDAAVLLVVADGDLDAACRTARAASATAQLIAALPHTALGILAQYCLEAGADDVLETPWSPGALVARVRAGASAAAARTARRAAIDTLAVIDDLAAVLAVGEPLEALSEALARLAEGLGFTRCAALTPGDEPNHIVIVAASDDTTISRLPLDLRKYPELRAALDTREAVFIEDAATNALLGDLGPRAAEHGGRSLLAVPLPGDRRPAGVLLLRSAQGRARLDEREQAACRSAARLFAVALRGGRVVEALREQTRKISLASYAEERRLRALDQYRDFFEAAADGVIVVDGDGEVLWINRSAEHITGYARSGLQGRTLDELVVPSQREGLLDVIDQAVAGVHLAGFDLQISTTSGEPLRVSVSTSAALAEHGAVVFFFRDVTVARQLEDELRKTKEFLERLIDSTVDGIVAADLRGNVMIFNLGAERSYGYSAEEVIGKIPVWRLYPEGVARQIMAELRSPDHGGPGRLAPSRREILTKDGEVVPVSLTASIVYEDGREVASVGIISDLRDRLRMEQRLQQAQEKLMASEKQALIAELAGTTAHELNQPLTSVMGYAELLRRRVGEDEVLRRPVDIILREAERMAEIVRKIGRITKYEIKAYVGSTTILDLDKSTREG